MDCGPACVRMVAHYHGKSYPLIYLRNLSYLSREGVSVAGITEGLGVIGVNARTFKMSLDELKNKCPLPAIIHWDQNHFVVLYKIQTNSRGKSRYYIADPAYGKNRFGEDDFAAGWLSGEKGVAIACEPTEQFFELEPPKDEHNIKKFLLNYLRPYKNELFQLSLAMVAGLVVSLITPFLTQALIDRGIGDRNLNMIVTIMLAQLALFVGSYVIGIIRNWVVLYMGTGINISLVSDFLYKVMRLPIKFFETKSAGDFNNRISDHYRLESFATSETLATLFSFVSFIVYFVIIALYDLRILLLYLIFSGVSIVWLVAFLKKRKVIDYKLFRIGSENQTAKLEMISGMSEIKLNNFQEYKRNEWEDIQQRLYEIRIRSMKLGQVQSAGYTLINRSRDIIVTLLIAIAVVKGSITLGMMMSISYIIGQMSSPLSQLIGFVQSVQDSKISMERSGEVYIQEDEDNRESYKPIPRHCDKIVLDGLSFRYEGPYSKLVLKDIDLVIPRGKTTAIVGESGSGKTTLVKLLLKFYPLTQGKIFIGDTLFDEYSADQWRGVCGVVMQDNYIFADTIRRNIILGDKEADEKRLADAIRIANLSKFIDEKPLRLDTKIGSAGTGISGGERQRIMIARAVYKNPDYLFFDEATSSLDAENERIIVENLDDFFVGKTVVVIAHRLSTVKSADQIVVLKDGMIQETGIHSELIQKNGVYLNLIKNQLELAD